MRKKLTGILLVFCLAAGLTAGLAACSSGGPAPQPSGEGAGIDPEKPSVTPSEAPEEGPVISFQTTDLEGNAVSSEDIFGAHTLTMVNLWGTYCGPCINEMPDLEELNGRLADRDCAIIGVVIDVAGMNDSAQLTAAGAILKDTGVTYLNLLPWNSLDADFPAEYIPTSYFVDSEGHIVGEAAVGSAGADDYEALIDAALAAMGN